MTSPTTTPIPNATRTAAAAAHSPAVYTVAPGYHVSFLARAREEAPFDLIEVVAARDCGQAPHRLAGATWFHVLEGQLQIVEADGDRLGPAITLSPGQTHVIAADVAHTVHNGGEHAVRFLIGGKPGTIASYLAQLGDAAELLKNRESRGAVISH
jgi:hypothetical protein